MYVSSKTARKICLAAAVLQEALFFTPAQAAHPLLTEDTGTQGLGKYQLELMV